MIVDVYIDAAMDAHASCSLVAPLLLRRPNDVTPDVFSFDYIDGKCLKLDSIDTLWSYGDPWRALVPEWFCLLCECHSHYSHNWGDAHQT